MAGMLRIVRGKPFRSIAMLQGQNLPVISAANVSTTKGKGASQGTGPEIVGDVEKFENLHKSDDWWITKGMSEDCKEEDRVSSNILFHIFAFVIVWSGVFFAYTPGGRWGATRAYVEAYLEIERRRNAGLPLVDKNVVDPANFTLPSDDEIPKDFEIIV